MFRLSIAVCPSSPHQKCLWEEHLGAYQNLPVVFSFTVHRKTELPWRGIYSAATGWLVVQVEPICAIISTSHAPHFSSNLPQPLPPLQSPVGCAGSQLPAGLLRDNLCSIPLYPCSEKRGKQPRHCLQAVPVRH